MMTESSYETILLAVDGPVATVTLNRPQALNALNAPLLGELVDALTKLDADEAVRCIVITGNERAFAAGADIKEMAEASSVDMLRRNALARYDAVRKIAKPIIAAVSGWALGGGCELAMACDMIVASETARFGQPEINIGIMPGAGGTQRLTRALGKARAMELILTGDYLSAQEAHARGLVNHVAPPELYLEEAQKLARRIAAQPPVAVRLAKDAVLKAQDLSIEEGLDYERRVFYLLFATEDQKEGMAAFIEKRPPQWKGR
jgi:enoyl-CoA hydratase